MTIDEYIKAVKVKLDEVSPYEEPGKYIESDDDDAFTKVKPIVTTITDCLPKAVWFCLTNLPLTLLAKDVTEEDVQVNIDVRGVGHVDDIEKYLRLVRLRTNEFNRDVTAFISTSDPMYILQQNCHTRGGASKPVAVYSPETAELELYSFNDCACRRSCRGVLWYVDASKKADKVKSAIEDFIVLICAAYVEEIMGDTTAAQVFQTEYNNKIESILK